MRNLRIVVILALAGGLSATAGLAADEPAELHILKACFDFGPRPGTDRLTLRAAFDPALLVEGRTPADGPLTVTITPVTVISLPPLEERMRLTSKNERVWKLRVRRTKEHRDSLKLKLHVAKGILKLTGERLDLREVRGLGAGEVTFTLTVAGTTFEKTLEMGVKQSRWRYRNTGKGQGIVGGNQGGGGYPEEPEDPEEPESIEFRKLRIQCYSVTFAPRTEVFRTEAGFAQEWAKYAADPYATMETPLPDVDFSKEIVILLDFGLQYLGGDYTGGIESVTKVGDGLHVEWMGWKTGGCPVPSIPESTCVFYAVTRRDGPVTFTKRSVTGQCQ